MKTLFSISLAATLFLTGCVSPLPDQPPDLAGQAVPNQNIVLDFTKRYDLICRDGQNTRTYKNSKIIGYTGQTVRDASGDVSKAFYGNFGRWLVIEVPGGRHVFLQPNSVVFLEETFPSQQGAQE